MKTSNRKSRLCLESVHKKINCETLQVYLKKIIFLILQVLQLRLHSFAVLDVCPSQVHVAVVDPGIAVEN